MQSDSTRLRRSSSGGGGGGSNFVAVGRRVTFFAKHFAFKQPNVGSARVAARQRNLALCTLEAMQMIDER